MKQSSVIILIIVGVVVLLGLALVTCIGLGAAMWLVGRSSTEAPPPEFLSDPARPSPEFAPAPPDAAPPPSEPAPGMADRPEPDSTTAPGMTDRP